MSRTLAAGVRVEVRRTILEVGDRAPGVPADTAAVPYEMRVRGRLTAPATLGARASILTPAGRILEGVVEVVEPGDDHAFGRPHPALVEVATRIAEYRAELHG